ncbi:MAG: hypothetical protein IJ109_06325 [Firmicutes bacterium]|nr:hypothetical protein [Bacillota bacterium]
MARSKQKVPVTLDPGRVDHLSDDDIRLILRAADELIAAGGRNMLVKILKGSRDKKVLEHELDQCPAYGCFRTLKTEEISARVDWMIRNDYLRIEYSGRLPLLVFSEKGWEIEQETFTRELFRRFRADVAAGSPGVILEMPHVGRAVVMGVLEMVRAYGDRSFIPQLEQWQQGEVKKVRARISSVISDLQRLSGLAVIFPGIGYTCDRSLLYYTAEMLKEHGYKVVPVPYTGFPKNVKGNALKMRQCYFSALDQAAEILKDLNFDAFDDILFVGKSVGTMVALSYARQKALQVRSILFTPVAGTFDLLPIRDQDAPELCMPSGLAIVFHGTSDPWAETSEIVAACEARNIPLHLVEKANHSLETGTTETDLRILETAVKQVWEFVLTK